MEFLEQVFSLLVVIVLHAARELGNHVHVGNNFGVLPTTQECPLKFVVPLDPRLHLFLDLMDVHKVLRLDLLLADIGTSDKCGIVLVEQERRVGNIPRIGRRFEHFRVMHLSTCSSFSDDSAAQIHVVLLILHKDWRRVLWGIQSILRNHLMLLWCLGFISSVFAQSRRTL